VFSDPNSPVTSAAIDTANDCNKTCGIRLVVEDPSGSRSICRLFVRVESGNEGCSHGYWMNHPESWGPTGYAPTDDFDTVFGVDAFNPDITLQEALELGGGDLAKLARHGVAALLDAAHPDVSFRVSVGRVLAVVQRAINTSTYEPAATRLDRNVNRGCPLD
jgi:hypothetical protein